MRSAATERDMWVGIAGDVERIRLGEDVLVAVAGTVIHDHFVTGPDLHVVHRRVLQGGPSKVDDLRDAAQHLLDRRWQQTVEVGTEPLALLGVVEQQLQAVGEQVTSRVPGRTTSSSTNIWNSASESRSPSRPALLSRAEAMSLAGRRRLACATSAALEPCGAAHPNAGPGSELTRRWCA